MSTLTMKHVSKTYAGGVKALDDVSLEISTGLFGLLGPNGAGKTTLMRTIATLQEPDEGTIQFDGLDVLKQKREVKERLGYLPQEFGFYPKESAIDFLDHYTLLKGVGDRKVRRIRVEELLHRVNLWNVRKQKLGTFSGGMKQRFGIALALVVNPELIIVDEPTAGLDPEERVRFHNLLSEIGENVIVILSTHIVDDVSDLCPNMAIIDEGRIIFSGRTLDAMAQLKGRIWERAVVKSDLSLYEKTTRLLSSRLFAGKTFIRIYSESNPKGFESVFPELKDVYFLTLTQSKQNPRDLDHSGLDPRKPGSIKTKKG